MDEITTGMKYDRQGFILFNSSTLDLDGKRYSLNLSSAGITLNSTEDDIIGHVKIDLTKQILGAIELLLKSQEKNNG